MRTWKWYSKVALGLCLATFALVGLAYTLDVLSPSRRTGKPALQSVYGCC